MNLTRRNFLMSAAALPALYIPLATRAQSIDTAKVIVGFPAGGAIDVVARRISDKLRTDYAKTVVVENRSGAGGQIAAASLKGAPSDGSVLLLSPMSVFAIYPLIYKKLTYNVATDFVPVSRAVVFGFGVAVGPAVPQSVRTLPELMAWFRAQPQQANYGTASAGSTMHFLGTLLSQAAKTEMRHVAYRGSQPAIQDVMGGQIPAVIAPLAELAPHLSSGRCRLLATSGKTRSQFFPDVPTLIEQGYQVHQTEWHGFFAPAKASPETVQRMNTALRAALAQPDVAAALAVQCFEISPSSPQELAKEMNADIEHWKKIVAATGFTPEN